MNIAIIGAGAGIGWEAVQQALHKGHQVTALSTNITQLPDHPNLVKIQGSATIVADLNRSIAHADAVLVTVGTKNKKRTTLFSEIARTLIDTGYKKPVLIITGFGAGDSKPHLNLFMKTVIRLFLKDQYADKTLMEDMIMRSDLAWEIVRPGMLGNGPGTGQYTVTTSFTPSKINRADVADYLVREAEMPKHLFQKVTFK